MSEPAYIEEYFSRHNDLYQYLVAAREVSYASDFLETFVRGLVLAIASFFEHSITEIMSELPTARANGDPVITSMVMRQVISRKYHTYFDWERLKPGPFLALLGDDFKSKVNAELKTNKELAEGIDAFLELGQIRNNLVHQNYVRFVVEKTPEELIIQFRKAQIFPVYLRATLLSSGSTEST